MFIFSDLSAAAGATAEPAPRNLYRVVVNRPYHENCYGTSSASVNVHGTSPENAREHAIDLVNDGEICWDDLDPEHDAHGGDGYEYDDVESSSGDEAELLGDSEDADYDTTTDDNDSGGDDSEAEAEVAAPAAAEEPPPPETRAQTFSAMFEVALAEAEAARAAEVDAEAEAEAETDCEPEPEPATD